MHVPIVQLSRVVYFDRQGPPNPDDRIDAPANIDYIPIRLVREGACEAERDTASCASWLAPTRPGG